MNNAGEFRHSCSVCRQAPLHPFANVQGTRYWRCPHCLATLMDPACRLDAGSERAVYELHENDPSDAGYRQFIRRLTDPLIPLLPAGAQGLDYGCGPGSALAAMLREQGFAMNLYDPFFAPDESVLARTYDFITCTEAAEHFFEPWQEFQRLTNLLQPGGILALMTSFLTRDDAFANWHYRRDPTHVVFYQEQTFQVLAELLQCRCLLPAPNLAFLIKKGG